MPVIPSQAPAAALRRRAVLHGAAATGLALAAGRAFANDPWPAKPVTLVVPFPAGGGTDAFARPLAAQFSKSTGKTLVIDNRGGAGGTVGASYAAKAVPDGYTLFMGGTHHVIAPSMYPRLDYDIEKDFIPLALLANVPQVLVVNPRNVPFTAFPAFLDHVQRTIAPVVPGDAFQLLLIPARSSRFTRPLFRTADEELMIGFDPLRSLPPGTDVEPVLTYNRSLYDLCRELGGSQYPISAIRLDVDDWIAHYGEQWPRLQAAKRRYDPGLLFRNALWSTYMA